MKWSKEITGYTDKLAQADRQRSVAHFTHLIDQKIWEMNPIARIGLLRVINADGFDVCYQRELKAPQQTPSLIIEEQTTGPFVARHHGGGSDVYFKFTVDGPLSIKRTISSIRREDRIGRRNGDLCSRMLSEEEIRNLNRVMGSPRSYSLEAMPTGLVDLNHDEQAILQAKGLYLSDFVLKPPAAARAVASQAISGLVPHG